MTLNSERIAALTDEKNMNEMWRVVVSFIHNEMEYIPTILVTLI